MDIVHNQTASGGSYSITVDGHKAHMDYSRVSPRLIILSHTEVPDELRGQGISMTLAKFVVADARDGGWKIIPLCPFFKSLVERHPDWQDVISH